MDRRPLAAEPHDIDDSVETRRLVVDAPLHGERLDKVLVGIAPEFSRNHLQGLIERGHVRVGDAVAGTASRRVKAGQSIAVDLMPTEESLAFRAEPMDLTMLYEDAHVLVIDKPAGLVVHPAPGNWSGTLLNGLLARDAAAGLLPRAGIVHRLDKDTSGVMVVGKTLPAVLALGRDIAARRVQRHYLALVHGPLAAESFTVDAPIGRDPKSRIRMAVVASGKTARTDVQWVAANSGFSALRCVLHTGRTHQIRVHLAHRGYPIVADAVYGGAPALGMQRQALHATHLAFTHPITQLAIVIDCAPPSDFASAWDAVTMTD